MSDEPDYEPSREALIEAQLRRIEVKLYLDIESIVYLSGYSALDREWDALTESDCDNEQHAAAMAGHAARWQALQEMYVDEFKKSAQQEAHRLGLTAPIEVIAISTPVEKIYRGYSVPGTTPPDARECPLEAHLWRIAFKNTAMIP